jgi:hypothetical protein
MSRLPGTIPLQGEHIGNNALIENAQGQAMRRSRRIHRPSALKRADCLRSEVVSSHRSTARIPTTSRTRMFRTFSRLSCRCARWLGSASGRTEVGRMGPGKCRSVQKPDAPVLSATLPYRIVEGLPFTRPQWTRVMAEHISHYRLRQCAHILCLILSQLQQIRCRSID